MLNAILQDKAAVKMSFCLIIQQEQATNEQVLIIIRQQAI